MSENDLPANWIRASLSDLGTWAGGGTPSKSEPSFWHGSIPWVSPKDMKTEFISDTEDHITPTAIEQSATRLIPAESVLVVTRSGILERTLPVATTKKPVTINQDLKALTPREGVRARYVALGLKAFEQRILKDCTKSGTTVANVEFASFLRFELPLAPTEEQDRIIAEVEKQFTRLDASVEALKRVQAQLKRYRASVLKAACEGRLVPTEAELARREKRDYEPADKLLARILKERRARWEADQLAKMKAAGKLPKDDKWKAKYVEPVAPETSGLPSLQSGWTWSTIDQLSSVVTKGSSPNWQGFDYCASGVLFVRSQNVGWGSLQLDERVFLPHAFNEKESRSVLADGDVLLNIVGASIGRVALATTELAGANINQAVALIRPVVPSLGAYVLRYLLSPLAQQYIHREKVDVARANFSLADVSEMPVPLPPLSEQQRIIFEAESRLSVGDAIELTLMSNETRATRLRQAVLKTAFEGSLVPQDPRDEPSSKLLESISAAVENKSLTKQGRVKQTTAVPKMKATR
ncbi:restriction endonuclease subunit S [Hyalangium rubrum]|uniref:Restriction endonuclease subunit S n=1 Tax=Hyalangium rubrum TaxID=3103134 RepID=A0ABU5H1Q9_9BACT|nr:restriction endonuclease subunit S [Hyalangium sp. s54d21]MDY7227064.1 restriction endonuclease subunit S [Hyalangium sp. s54d21]